MTASVDHITQIKTKIIVLMEALGVIYCILLKFFYIIILITVRAILLDTFMFVHRHFIGLCLSVISAATSIRAYFTGALCCTQNCHFLDDERRMKQQSDPLKYNQAMTVTSSTESNDCIALSSGIQLYVDWFTVQSSADVFYRMHLDSNHCRALSSGH